MRASHDPHQAEALSPAVMPAVSGLRAGAGGPERDPKALFAGLDTAPALLLAVSGGPDSIALMLLAAQWAGQTPREAGARAPKLHVATVDHGLRPEAHGEAQAVAAAAAKLGLPHAILTWTGTKPKTRIQERARLARYALLAAHARSLGATHVLTAHHAGDQAETILFRLGRGSGPGGLAGMRRETVLEPGLFLTRPLLDLPKTVLMAICHGAGFPFADDPSNHDSRYARARLRAERGAALALGLDSPTLLRLAARLARAEEALEAETRRCLDLAEAVWAPGRFTATLAPIRTAKPEILIRILRHGFENQTVSGFLQDRRPPRLDRLEALADKVGLALRTGAALRTSLHGSLVTLERDAALTIVPEPPRRRGRPH